MRKATGAALLVLLAVAAAAPQNQPRRLFDDGTTTTPKPIVQIKRLINQQNGDGSYTYGFEADDGSFKIETRDLNGNVKGKYGYIDVNNELKVVDYTAGNGTGFDAKADFFPKPVQPLPVEPQQEAAPQRPPARSFQHQPQPQPQRRPQPRPQPQFEAQPQFQHQPQPQQHQPAPPQQQAAHPGISHFNDPQGVFQFSFPSPGEPARAAPQGSFSPDGEYIPTIALEGFSEDADRDGFVDPVPQDGSLPVRARDRVAARPSFTQVSSEPQRERPQIPQQLPPPQQQQRPRIPQHQPQQQFPQLPPGFTPPQSEEAQGPIPSRFAFGTDFFGQQQPQFFGPPQQQDPRFAGFQPAAPPSRFLQGGPVQQQVPVFQGSTERSRVSFVNPLSLQQQGGHRPQPNEFFPQHQQPF